jgi:phosphinothricin acetyltransferase
MNIRRAALADAAGINAIYNPVIRESPATFETVEHTLDDRVRWLDELSRSPRHQVFVAEEEGRIIGYANSAAFDPRGAYETSVKVSVFVAPANHSQGVGRKLYAALFDALSREDVHRAYGLIVAPNPASVALHEALGFRQVSTLNEVGRKFGRFYDVMWFEKRLS